MCCYAETCYSNMLALLLVLLSPVWACILHALPLALAISPQHQLLSQQLHCMWPAGICRLQCVHWVPVLCPFKVFKVVCWVWRCSCNLRCCFLPAGQLQQWAATAAAVVGEFPCHCEQDCPLLAQQRHEFMANALKPRSLTFASLLAGFQC
jgi:hypothetical protein